MRIHTKASRSRALAIALVIAVFLTACGASDPVAEPPPATVAPTTAPAPTATEVPPTAVPEPTPTPVPPTPEPTATPEPEPTSTPEPEPTAEPAATEEAAEEPATEEPATEEAATEEPAADGEVALVIDAGAIYSMNCARCHGENGEGATARAITGVGAFFVSDDSPLVNLVTNGGVNMPSFGSKLSGDEINAVVDYVVATFQ